ncbi:MAG: glutathione S-transferase family protein [Pseudomonadota bacterium]
MLRLYSIPVSLYCAKLRILLRHKDLDWTEMPPPGGYGSDEYKDLVPSGNLPALVDGGLMLADSEAIAEYLDEKFPERPMLPEDVADRALIRERSRFHDTRLEPAVRALFPYLPGRESPPDGFIDAQSEIISARLRQLAKMLRPDAGHELTLGDCGFAITFAWIEELTPRMELGVRWPGRLGGYRARVAALPAVSDELDDYRPKLKAFLDGSV